MKQFQVWALCVTMAAGSVAAMAADKGDPAKGKELFGQCAGCHDAESTDKKMGPGLKGLFKHDKLANGKKLTEASIRAQIDQGGGGMPPYKDSLSDAERDNLVAYLKTL